MSRFCVDAFLSHNAEKFRGHPSNVSDNLGYRKFLCIREGGGFTFLRRKHLSHSTKSFRWGTVRCFRKIRLSQNFGHKRGVSLKSVEKFLSHTADKNRRRTLLCFERILQSKIFKQKRGKLQGFVGSFCYLTGPKKIRQGTILHFTNFLVVEKFLWMRGGSFHDYPSKIICLIVPKFIHWRTILCFKKFFITKFSMHLSGGGGVTVPSKFFVSQDRNEKFCKGPLLFSRKLMITKNFMHNSGITFFRRKLLVSQCPNISWASLQCFRKLGVSKNFMQNREYHNFPSKNVCFIEPKNFVKEPITVSLVSGIKKRWG